MAKMDRRRFLKHTAGTGMAGFAALQGIPLVACLQRAGSLNGRLATGGYGPLQAAGPDFSLPAGFQYRKFGVTGSLMRDGIPTPPAHDGMAAFPLPNGNIRLIRNHEVGTRRDGQPIAEPVYDQATGGGTTSLEIDPATRQVVDDFVSLSGTAVNCAGGPTPWGSWLSCEETVVGPPRVRRDHGYVFEVPARATGPVEPVPIREMGRFEHEAAAVDPATGIVYLTEDLPRSGFYRFLPARPYRDGLSGDLRAGGELQMLVIKGRPNLDTGHNREVGVGLEVQWVTIDDPDPANAQETSHAVFEQGWRQGAAEFSRVEGCFYADGSIYFTCTDGGDAERGQIWHYRPQGEVDGELTLLFESPSVEILDNPDNICVSPRGGVLITEDGSFRNYIRGLTRAGTMFDFAENIANRSEIAGPTFSPDGNTLFVNLQRSPGATYAIWGPWESGGL